MGTADGQPLLLRVDGDRTIGSGHVMRSIALAEAWRNGAGVAHFVVARLDDALGRRIRNGGFDIRRIEGPPDDLAEATANAASDVGAACVAIDGYELGRTADRLTEGGLATMVVDDHGRTGAQRAGIVLDQNVGAIASTYRGTSASRLLLGPRYALLRAEYDQWRGWKREAGGGARRALIAVGGGALPPFVVPAARVLRTIAPAIEIVLTTPSPETAAEARAALGRDGAVVRAAVDDMPAVIAEADVAVTAAGSVVWELCMLGMPALLVPVADNQIPVAEGLRAAGAALAVTWSERFAEEVEGPLRRLVTDESFRAEIAFRAAAVVDGLGARRAAIALRARLVALRPARAEDAEVLWRWANDEDVRRWSFTGDSIPWEDHISWLGRKLRDPTTRIYIGADPHGALVGQVRFDGVDRRPEIGVSVAPDARGCGFGGALVTAAVERLFSETRAVGVTALVKEDNVASRRTFVAADFDELSVDPGRGVVEYVLPRARVDRFG